MRRTDEEFINEVYKRKKEHLKKKKQRTLLLTFLVPLLVLGSVMLPAMLPASSADKSAPPMTDLPTVSNDSSVSDPSEPDDGNRIYPPGTIIVSVSGFDSENSRFTLEGSETADFIERNIRHSLQGSSQNFSSALADEDSSDSKKENWGEKICDFSFSVTNVKYEYSLYENGVYDELSETWYSLDSEKTEELRSILFSG